MDAHSVSFTSSSRDNSSRRIYQDLKAIHLLSLGLGSVDPTQLAKSLYVMDQRLEVPKYPLFPCFFHGLQDLAPAGNELSARPSSRLARIKSCSHTFLTASGPTYREEATARRNHRCRSRRSAMRRHPPPARHRSHHPGGPGPSRWPPTPGAVTQWPPRGRGPELDSRDNQQLHHGLG